jgi:hypothetical protein
MKKELGIARCGLACCLCCENDTCKGCNAGDCPQLEWCENRSCSAQKGLAGCFDCGEACRRGLLSKTKPYGFMLFARGYGREALLSCLEANERLGIVYHREGHTGDYDGFENPEELIAFIKTGKRPD